MMNEHSKYKIYIDASSRYEKTVCLLKIDGTESTEIARKSGDIDVVIAVKDLLAEANLTLKDIELIEPNVGPGSFTGLKIGVTAANVFMWALGKKSIKDLYVPNYGKEPNVTVKSF